MDVAQYVHSLSPGQWDAHQVCGAFVAFGGLGLLYRPAITYAMVLGAGLGGLLFSDLSIPLHRMYMLAAMLVGSVSLAPDIRKRASWQFTVATFTVAVGGSLFIHNHGIPDLQHYAVGMLAGLGGVVMVWTTHRPSIQPFGGLIMIVTGVLLFNYTSPDIRPRQDFATSETHKLVADSFRTVTQDTSRVSVDLTRHTHELKENIH